MKPRINPFVRFSSLLTAATIACTASAHAADLTWNGETNNNWNTTHDNWATASIWNNATPDNAFFNTNTGTITLTEAITAGNFTFGLTNANTNGAFAGSALTINGNMTVQADNNNGPGVVTTSFSNNVTVAGDVVINRRVLEITDGTFTANRIGSTNAWGRLIVSGGSVTATNGVDDSILGGGVAMSVFLTGGTLSTSYIKTTSATWTGLGDDGVVLNGGTLRATASSTDFIQTWDPGGWGIRNNVGIGTAGAIIDTNGFDIAINRTLEDFGGAGSLTKNGAGKLTLVWSGHSGGSTVNAGTLEYVANSGYSLLRNLLTVNAGGTVSVLGDGTGLGWQSGNKVTTLNINGGTVTSPGTMHVWAMSGGVNMTGGTLQSNNGVSDANGTQLEWNQTSVTTNASADIASIGGRIRIRSDGGYTGIAFDVANGAAATDLLVSAAITEAAVGMGITKSGAGTMTLSGVNNYTGNTTINGGTLKIAEGASIYNGGHNPSAVLTVNQGGTLELSRWGYGPGGDNQSLGGLDYNPARFVINGGTVKYTGGAAGAATNPAEAPYGPGFTIGALGATLDAAKANDTWTVKNDSRGYGPIASNDGGTLTLTGVGSGVFDKELGGSGGLVMNGSATWTLNRSNSYTGGTTVNQGTLLLTANAWTLGNNNNSGAVTVGSGATLRADNSVANQLNGLTLNGGTVESVNSGGNGDWGNFFLTGNVTASGSSSLNADVALRASNVDFNVASGGTLNVGGILHNGYGFLAQLNGGSADGTAASTVSKSGSGTMILNGTHTYTGATTVSAGTLLVTGQLGNSAITVSGGAFGGTGTVGGGLTINSGLFHVTNLLDALDVSGSVSLFAGFGIDDLAGLDWGSVSDGTYTLINGTLASGVFAALANNSLATAYDIDGSSGNRSAYFREGSLQLVVIPEPRAALLGSLGMLALLRRRRA